MSDRAAATERQRQYRARKQAAGWHLIRGVWTDAPRKQRAPGEEPPHGTYARYVWSKDPCRCAECRAVNASETRKWRHARRKK